MRGFLLSSAATASLDREAGSLELGDLDSGIDVIIPLLLIEKRVHWNLASVPRPHGETTASLDREAGSLELGNSEVLMENGEPLLLIEKRVHWNRKESQCASCAPTPLLLIEKRVHWNQVTGLDGVIKSPPLLLIEKRVHWNSKDTIWIKHFANRFS